MWALESAFRVRICASRALVLFTTIICPTRSTKAARGQQQYKERARGPGSAESLSFRLISRGLALFLSFCFFWFMAVTFIRLL